MSSATANKLLVTVLGFSRMGVQRELKKALESFWSGHQSAAQLQSTAKDLRARHWRLQRDCGVASVPCNDHSLYDHMLDMAQVLGCIPARYERLSSAADPLALYFAQARGQQAPSGSGGVTAMEMTKWFDTNYHYIVPELTTDQKFSLHSSAVLSSFHEAVAVCGADATHARPVLVGPVTFLLLSKLVGQKPPAVDNAASEEEERVTALLRLLPAVLAVYVSLLRELAAAGAQWVQLDEPVLVTDAALLPAVRAACQAAYAQLRSQVDSKLKFMLATYFGGVSTECHWVYELPVQCVHVDVTRSTRAQLDTCVHALGKRAEPVCLSLGVVDGRNVWKGDFEAVLQCVRPIVTTLGAARVWLAPSCSLLHAPVDLSGETALPAQLKDWLSFAVQKLHECHTLARAAVTAPADYPTDLAALLAANAASVRARATSPLVCVAAVRDNVHSLVKAAAAIGAKHVDVAAQQVQSSALTQTQAHAADASLVRCGAGFKNSVWSGLSLAGQVQAAECGQQCAVPVHVQPVPVSSMFRRLPYAQRAPLQQAALQLPLLPTTTIGSFPQTEHVRQARAKFRSNRLTAAEYESLLRDEIGHVIAKQSALGLDVLVHGEAERTDMVEYFGEQLTGFAFTLNGWVQSYGSRCVKPPILYGDVSTRSQAGQAPMTVAWSRHAQSLSTRPVKAMLTGPVTILQWSFVRDDQPRRDTCLQVAVALREEVLALEQGGLKVIQIDEPALAEGQPLCRGERSAYYDWSTMCFRVCVADVQPSTQVHSHMCYCEFDHVVLDAMEAMEPDVISLEASRSQRQLLAVLHARAAARRARAPHGGGGSSDVDCSGYLFGIGPGMYDIHSPRVPPADEMCSWLRELCDQSGVPANRLWVNPDCGLKTRNWPEVEAALANMVAAAKTVRAEHAAAGGAKQVSAEAASTAAVTTNISA